MYKLLNDLRHRRRRKLLAIVVPLLTLAGCTPDQAKRLEYGEPAPGFRIRVTFDEPWNGERLVDHVQASINELSFTPMDNPREAYKKLGVPEHKWLSVTYTSVENGNNRFRLNFPLGYIDNAGPQQGAVISFVDYNFVAEFGESLSFEEWAYFYRLKTQILPKTYENAEISVVTHPKVFTDDKQLSRIARVFGEPI